MDTITISDLLHLSVAERLQLAADLWDSIAVAPERIPVTEAQSREVLRRSETYRRDPGGALALNKVLERIEGSLG